MAEFPAESMDRSVYHWLDDAASANNSIYEPPILQREHSIDVDA